MDLINLDILRIGRRWNLGSPQATPEFEVVAESSLAGDGTGQASAPRIQETPEIEQIVRFFRGGDSTGQAGAPRIQETPDRKSTRLNSSHRCISYAVFCLKK